MSKGMHECVVCHREFALIAEEHYVAKDPQPTGIAALANAAVYPYDAIDCPHCGCQNVLQKRKPFACPCDYDICDECDCECTEDGDDDYEPSVEEMKEFLKDFCRDHTCDDCPLTTFRCGNGVHFKTGMTEREITAAYKVVKEVTHE